MSTERELRTGPGPEPTLRTPRPGGPKPAVSTTAGMVLQLQSAAGNLAVARALQRTKSAAAGAVPPTVQLEGAGTGGQQPGPQLAALWNAQVVVPLARAQDRVGRATPDYKGAKVDLVGALRTIALLRDATPSSDRNRLRYEIIERRAQGVLEIVNQHLGIGRTDSQLSGDTIKIRVEATELGPKLEHRPGPDAAKAAGDKTPTSTEPSPTPADTPDGPAANGGSDAEGSSIADLWDFLVVKRLWAAQKQLADDPKFAIMDYNNARLYILLFLQATPEGHPNRLPLIKLDAGVEAIAGQTASRAPDLVTSDPLDEQAVNVWETATAMVEFIPGASAPAATEGSAGAPAAGAKGGAAGGTQEPDFTWEREPGSRPDDTALERP